MMQPLESFKCEFSYSSRIIPFKPIAKQHHFDFRIKELRGPTKFVISKVESGLVSKLEKIEEDSREFFDETETEVAETGTEVQEVTEAALLNPEVSQPCLASSKPDLESDSKCLDLSPSQSALLGSIHDDLKSKDSDRRLIGAQSLVEMLSDKLEQSKIIDAIIKTRILSKLVGLLDETRITDLDLQLKCTSILINISAGTSEQTQSVIETGALPPLFKIMNSKNTKDSILLQALWVLTNIIGDSSAQRNFMIRKGVLPQLVKLAFSNKKSLIIRQVTCALVNLCRYEDFPPSRDVVQKCLPALIHLLNSKDHIIVKDVCWGFSYLTEWPEGIEEVTKSEAIPKLVQTLSSKNDSVCIACLRALGNIVAFNDSHTKLVLKAGFLSAANNKLVASTNSSVVKETLWIISNIAVESWEEKDCIVRSNIVPQLINVLQNGDLPCQVEAMFAVVNLVFDGSVEHVVYVIKQKVIPPLCELLKNSECNYKLEILNGLKEMLSAAGKLGEVNTVASEIKDCGGVETMNQIISRKSQIQNSPLSMEAEMLLKTFFSNERC